MVGNVVNDPELIRTMAEDRELDKLRSSLCALMIKYKYVYNFSWLGIPIIQLPQDVMAVQEIIWSVKPRLIIETGIAHGGSLVFYASMLELIGGDSMVLGIDIDIRAHNRVKIESHPLSKRIRMLSGSSISYEIAKEVGEITFGKTPVMLLLDSNHTRDHVSKELELYSPLVTKGSYLVVYDTVIEDLQAGSFPDRPWDKGNNPKTAVMEFLKNNDRFVVDRDLEDKLMFTVSPNGYLKCVKD